MSARRNYLRTLALLALPLAATACGDPDQYLPPGQAGGPKGVLDGTVTYSGPLPCTENNHVVGAAVILVFDVRGLPPPDGLGTTPASLATIGGDELFAGVRGRLTFNANKTRWCPDASLPPVTVSASFAAAPLDAGIYQVRGFYDFDGNFDPVFSISNLPTKGDIGGGAIDNVSEVLMGKPPRYREIALGGLNSDGVRVIPSTGARIGGISVTLALKLPLERPIFYPKAVADMISGKNMDPLNVTMPSDYQLDTFDQTPSPAAAGATEKSFIRLTLGAGVAPNEADLAAQKPFNLPPAMPPPFFFYNWQDVNRDGVLDIAADHVPDSAKVPSLFPLSIFTLLSKQSDLVQQSDPLIVMQGLTIYKSLFLTAASMPTLAAPLPDAIVALRPAVLCLPANPAKGGVLVITHQTDKNMHQIVADPAALSAALSAQFKRKITIAYGCLPEGRYAMNLIYGTGQAWTIPNDAGVCAPSEPLPDAGALECKAMATPSRPRLASQAAVVTIGDPDNMAYCTSNPIPALCLPPKPPAM